MLLTFTGSCSATKPPAEQYVNIAPLPGAGVALSSEGKPDGQGAMQINIPIAYTPGSGYAEASAYVGQWIGNQMTGEWHNGSGVFAMGFGNWPRVYASGMAVSHLLNDSKALSGQIQLTKETSRTPAFAIGAQDILNKEHGQSETANTGASYYAVATKGFDAGNRKLYASLGFGAARFLDRPFGGISLPINNRLTFATEYDGFQINNAIAWRPTGRFSSVTVMAGYNSEVGPMAGIHFTGKLSSFWALPATLLLKH